TPLRNTCPLIGAYDTYSPLHALHFRYEKTTTVASAFERRRDFCRFQFLQLIEINFERFLDFAFDSQPPFVFVDLRNREMVPNVKRFCRRDEIAEIFHWRFENERLLAQNHL